MRVVVALAVGLVVLTNSLAEAQISWPDGIYTARAKLFCKGNPASNEARICTAAFKPVATGKLLTVTLATCRLENSMQVAQTEDLYLGAISSAPIRSGDIGFPPIHLFPNQMPVKVVFYASLVGEAYYAGGLTPTVTAILRKDEAAWSGIRLDCAMQGWLSSR